MTLLAPWALWLALVAGGVVALYVLKIRRRREPVPALEFWRSLVSQAPARTLFQRLKRLLSLLLWLGIVALLVLATANPVIALGRVKPRSIAVILDNSASMQARTGADGAARADDAREAVTALSTRRPVNDEWLLIEAASEPRVRAAWTRDRRAVREAAAAIEPFVGEADLEAALDLARELLRGKPEPCAVIVSDGANGAVAKLAEGDERVIPWIVGAGDDNLGIVRLRARVHREQLAQHVYVRIVNAGSAEVTANLVLELDGSAWAVEPFTVAARAIWEKTVVLAAPDGGALRASIDRDDVLAIDNEAFAILEPIRSARILLVTAPHDAYFFERALTSMEPLVSADESRTMTIEEYDALEPQVMAMEPPDLTIFNRCTPARWSAKGAFIFIDEWPEAVAARVIGRLDAPHLTLSARDHALARYLDLRPVRLAHARHVDLAEAVTVLATTTEGLPLIFLHEAPDRAALCLGFDVLESDLPFRNAFPVLLRNAVACLVTEHAAWLRDQYPLGEVIEPLRSLPPDVGEALVVRSGREESEPASIAVRNGTFAFSETLEPGVLRFEFGERQAYTALNLLSERETRLAASVLPPASERLALSGRLLGSVPWLALAMLATALIAMEWLTFHFRWTE